MTFKITQTSLPGVVIIEPQIFGDDRGFFLETFHLQKYDELGLQKTFVQDNHSRSTCHVIRGLHYQLKHPQAKLVYVVRGEIFDVAVDIRRNSETFGRWTAAVLSDKNHQQMFIPQGFAHGFCVLSDSADVTYKCTDFYTPGDDFGIHFADPDINIDWPSSTPILSEKDQQNPTLKSINPDLLPTYQP
ncbi:MAG: dTDP-4-dehydrorhamnose 3,5-epimerase [Sedimentisphaerales bacterium]|nr:dTDP-4-dehydrorhamnose 3,5-epimerase [Sedimentisphaerales bacterium]